MDPRGDQLSGDIDASPWSALITFDANGEDAVKVLAELTATIAQAERQVAGSPDGNQLRFVCGPLPRLNGNPAKDQVWRVSGELPVKGWPTSGSYFKDPLA